MSYDYDVFLSYRRFGEWPQWVDRQFLPLFRHWLGEELGRKPSIFVDREGIESGDSWPLRLAKAHSTSRVLVGLWSRTYFESKWCQAELARMLARHRTYGIPTPELERRIKSWVPGIAHSIGASPEYDSSWLHEAADAFLGLLVPKSIVPALPRLG